MALFNRILIVNPFGIGDVLFTTPLIAALKEQYPGVSVSYLANARTAPILRNDPRIDQVLVYERDEFIAVYRKSPWRFLLRWKALIDEIRAGRFEVAFDLSMGPPLGLALAWAGVPERIGFNYKGRGRWLTQSVPLAGYEGKHVAEYYLDLLTRQGAGGGEVGPIPQHPMSIYPAPADDAWAAEFMRAHNLKPKSFLVIYPGGGASWGKDAFQKRWAVEKYAQLADKIIENTPLAIILLGDQKEVELCGTVQKSMRSPAAGKRVVNAAGCTSLLQATALMRHSRCVIANDGGPLHVAVASGVSTVSIFGPVDPVVYGPFPRDKHKVVVKGLACQPCYRGFRMSDCNHLSCLKLLTVGDVYNTIGEYL
jgi:lipopolysaccharide heptosyltransferase II